MVDKAKIMQRHLLTEVVVEVEDELGKKVYMKVNVVALYQCRANILDHWNVWDHEYLILSYRGCACFSYKIVSPSRLVCGFLEES